MPEHWQAWAWWVGVLLTAAAWRRQLPWSNVGVLLLLSFLAAWGLLAWLPLDALPDWRAAGARLPGGIPWPLPLMLAGQLLAARAVARCLWRNRRDTRFYGYELMTLTACLALALWTSYRPLADLCQWWLWLLFLILLQTALVPWFLRKQPVPPPADWLGPIAWLAWVAGGLPDALAGGLSATVRLILMTVPAVLALLMEWRAGAAARAE